MTSEAYTQYTQALKLGQKYYRSAVGTGKYPYPTVLDEIMDGPAAGRREMGFVNVPADRIAGTKSAGRSPALAGNFMPLLGVGSEFATKWMRLCDAHLSDTGIRDPIQCYEYLGRFYVEEGNKRASVLLSYGAPFVPAYVTRLVPRYSEDPAVQIYYEFMEFYDRAGLYGVDFTRPGSYDRLQAALGMEPDRIWSEEERASFESGFSRFRELFRKENAEGLDVTPADALLIWLQVFPFSDLKDKPAAELAKSLSSIWPDIRALRSDPIELRTEPDTAEKGAGAVVPRLLSLGHTEQIKAAFIYAFDPRQSIWTRDHVRGREYLESVLGERLTAKDYSAEGRAYYETMEAAVADGANLIFATTPPMIAACRRVAAQHPEVKVLCCALSLPYTGVRMYYSRIYEVKFITGAIAGAMAASDRIGYIANYPIVGVPAGINAFALGARLTNPRARVKLLWSCLPGNPVRDFLHDGITVISNRDAVNNQRSFWDLEWGTYFLEKDGTYRPLACPVWDWGKLYERMVRNILDGAWEKNAGGKAINYWWGIDSGVIDVELSDALPEGMRTLAGILKNGLAEGSLDPFRTPLCDQHGTLRCDGSHGFSPEELMTMDWLCDTVDGEIPEFGALMPRSQELVRHLGLHRDTIPPEKAGEEQLKK